MYRRVGLYETFERRDAELPRDVNRVIPARIVDENDVVARARRQSLERAIETDAVPLGSVSLGLWLLEGITVIGAWLSLGGGGDLRWMSLSE